MIFILFMIIFFSYSYFLYKNGFRMISLFFLSSYALSFMIPSLVDNNDYFGYQIPFSLKENSNKSYLISLVFFVIANIFTQFFVFKSNKKVVTFSKKRIKKIMLFFLLSSFVFILFEGTKILSGTTHMLENSSTYKIIHAILLLGLILFSGLYLLLIETKSEKIIGTILFMYAILFGVIFVFGRRLVLYPLITLYLLKVIKNKKKPRLINLVIIVCTLLFIVLPLMMSIRTYGFLKGIPNFINVVFSDKDTYLNYISLGTDVSASYNLANIIINYGIKVETLVLFKPLFSFIPRSIWPDKPYPLSESIVSQLNLHFEKGMSIPLGFVGEPYVYFGTTGIVFWPIFFGILLGIIDSYINKQSQKEAPIENMSLIFVIIMSIHFVMGLVRGDVATNVQEMMYIYIPLAIIYTLTKYKIKG